MILSINNLHTILTVSSTLLDDFIATPGDYTKITITGYFNDVDTGVTEEYDEDNLITSSTNVATSAGVETINPAFFTTTSFAQGVYHFLITLYGTDIESDEGCIFVDDTLGCTIDDYRLEETNQFKKLNAGIDYFILKNTANCQCNCNELIEIYNNLITQTSNSNCTTC